MSRTPGRTPGRAKRGEETYLPYNADPKKVGTRSNAQMPTNVQRTEDGFEDPEAFFYSPTNTDATNRSMATTAFQTPGGISTYSAQTPMTAGSVGVLRRTGSRLSGMDYDDEDDEIADDLLVDEDDLRMATPSQNASQRYFPQINPPSVILPTRSRPLVDSPSVNMSFDALPSPSRSLRTPHAVNRSPRKSVASLNQSSPSSSTLAKPSSMNGQDRSPLRASRGGVDLGEEEDITSTSIADYSAMSMDISIAASPSRGPTRTSPRRGKTTSPNQSMRNAARKSRSGQNLSMAQGDGNDSRLEDDSQIDDEDRPDVTPDAGRKISRMSTMSKKSNATRNGDDVGDEDLSRDREGSFSDNDNAPDFGYDAGPDNGSELDGFNDTVNDVSIGFDDDDVRQSGNVGSLVDDMAAGGGEERADEEGAEDISMEQEAVADEERSGEEEEVTPQPKKRGPPKKAAQATRERAPPRPRGVREGSVAAKPRKTRISQIGLGNASESDEEDGYHGNFATRRSKRKHFKPLEWWRNEHFEYARGPGLPVIKEVVTYPEEPPTPFAQRHKRGRTRTGRSISAAPNGKRRKNSLDDDEQEAEDDEQTWDAQTVPSGLVQDYPTKNEVYRRIACIKAQLEPRAVSKGAYQYQKVFGEGQFMAAGVVYIPIGSSKATKPSKDNAYVFYVIQGVVQVTVHRTSFVMAPGGQFLIPRGNEYRIENISPNREVQLFFAQARKLRADESELEPSYATTAAAAGDRLSVSLDENTSKTGATSKRTSKNKDKDV